MWTSILRSFWLLTALLVTSCGNPGSQGAGQSLGIEDADEVALGAVDALLGAANTSGAYLAWREGGVAPVAPLPGRIWGAFAPSAQAATCGSPGGTILGTCNVTGGGGSSRTRQFSACTIGSCRTASGSVTLAYSSTTDCSTPPGNGTVTRTPSLLLTGRRNASLSVSATTHTDYRGNSIGGGQTLTFTAGSGTREYTVPGIRRVLTSSAGETLADLSFRTTDGIRVTGTTLTDLRMDGGTLEAAHNRALYTAAWTPHALAFQAGCACPVSGSMQATLSGGASGSLVLEFSACGSAKLSREDASMTLTLDSCAGST